MTTRAIIFDFFGVVRVAGPKGPIIDQALLAYIAELKKTYKTALLSNTGSGRLADFIPANQQARYFDAVVTPDEIAYIKPQPEAYLAAAARLGVPPEECVMVDDLSSCCQGAKGVGMQAIQYVSLVQFKQELFSLLSGNAGSEV